MMNKQLQEFARNTLKEGLSKLPESNHAIFKRMYSPDNLKANIDSVIDAMPENKLDWAMQQVQRTLEKNNA